ncbi:unnamed protein product [Cochlearia groenlandica]
MLLALPDKPMWSIGFGLFLLARQLEVAKKHEIWVLFDGKLVSTMQLPPTAITVSGFLHALQLVLLEIVPTIQEGIVQVNKVLSDSEDEAMDDQTFKQIVALKLGHARDLDYSCEGGVTPSSTGVRRVLPQRGVKALIMRTRKGKKPATGASQPARKSMSKSSHKASQSSRRSTLPNIEPIRSPQLVDVNILSSLIGEKLVALENRKISGVTKWISEPVIFAGNAGNESTDKYIAPCAHGSATNNTTPEPGQHNQSVNDRGKRHVVPEDSVEDIAAYHNACSDDSDEENTQTPKRQTGSRTNDAASDGDMEPDEENTQTSKRNRFQD